MPVMREPIERRLDDAFSAAPFRDRRTTVVLPDRTRPIDYDEVLPPLLERLERAGAELTVLVGAGLHRPLSEGELAPLVDLADAHGARLLQHDADASEQVLLDEDVGDRPSWPALPAHFHRSVVRTDAVVSVGAVEPHQYAGFSGGVKGVTIGCAAAETIGAMHGLAFLRLSGTRLGAVAENPFRRALRRLADPIDPKLWGLQVVPPGPDGAPPRALWGDLRRAFERAVSVARQRFFVAYDDPIDWLELAVPDAKATNFYQASRAATYAALVDSPALTDGGTVLVEAPCPEGIGRGEGERACADALERGRRALADELASDREIETCGGQQRAYVLARALQRCQIGLVGARKIPELSALGIPQFGTVEAARRDLGYSAAERRCRIDDPFRAVPVSDRD